MGKLMQEMVGHPFLKDFKPETLEKLSECADKKEFGAGSILFKEGESAEYLYLISDGKIAIELALPNRNPLTILTIEQGGVVGWSWLFPPYNWHFQARALAPTTTIMVKSVCLRDMCEEDATFGYELLRKASRLILERLEGTTQQLMNSFDLP